MEAAFEAYQDAMRNLCKNPTDKLMRKTFIEARAKYLAEKNLSPEASREDMTEAVRKTFERLYAAAGGK